MNTATGTAKSGSQSYFASPVAEETEEEPAESGINEPNIENYLHNENENENISDIIEHQGC